MYLCVLKKKLRNIEAQMGEILRWNAVIWPDEGTI